MTEIWLALTLIAASQAPAKPVMVQNAKTIGGRTVKVCLDGRKVETAFAGMMGFRSQTSTWGSFCADVRSPIRQGQTLGMVPTSSKKLSANYQRAAAIVAVGFDSVRSADQAAGMQVAIWEAIEDNGSQPNFQGGRFQVVASQAVLSYAQQYYAAGRGKKEAVFLVPTDGRSQAQVTPSIRRGFNETIN